MGRLIYIRAGIINDVLLDLNGGFRGCLRFGSISSDKIINYPGEIPAQGNRGALIPRLLLCVAETVLTTHSSSVSATWLIDDKTEPMISYLP